MFRFSLSLSRYLALLLLALVIASGVYALAAANNVNENGAGEGVNAITDYVVDSSTIRYALDYEANPRDIKKVEFRVNLQSGSNADQPSEVYAQIDSGNWVNCTSTDSILWECPFSSPYPQVRLSPPTILHVATAQ